jgi:CubicO group peptidase (beta-lactamase class C family)
MGDYVSGFETGELDAYLKQMTDKDAFSGVVLVDKEGEVILERAYGFACKTFGVKNRIDTKFNVGSLNKIFTKIAILQLKQKGLLKLDDLVGTHLPDFREDIATKVRISHLIEFTSGLGDYFNEKFSDAIGRLRTVDDFIALFINDPLLFEPGEGQQYSNAGYVVLGKIIEAVSGIDYYDYIRNNIYKPAGMKDSDHYERDIPVANLATGYTRQMPDGTKHQTSRRRNDFIIGTRGSPAGGGYSTLKDLRRFDEAVSENVLLDEDHSKMVFRPLNTDPSTNPKSVLLAGGAPGLTALYLKFFHAGYTVFILSNYDPEDIEPLSEHIRSMIMPLNEGEPTSSMRNER